MSCCPNMQRNDWMIEIILFCNFGVPTSTKGIHENFENSVHKMTYWPNELYEF